MEITGVIDRIVEGIAVVLIQPDEKQEILWPEEYLPEDAREGSILRISVVTDYEETKERKERVSNLIEKLKKNLRDEINM